ncbi:MAG TPA: SGNH/GDSL hydrolase family protein [Ktedonobacteraceae bacterium]|nr:SGNH/GDSL hydrolase family protein [Ktedonobacteraceae bacterium]
MLPMLLLCFLLLVGCGTQALSSSTGGVPVQQAPHARLTYVAIGASDSFGIGADDPRTENWPTDLATMLGPGVQLINLGVPGITAHQAISIELPVALDAHPNLVTIWLAVNDIIDNVPVTSYSHDLDQILTRLRSENPDVHIIVGNVPELTLLPYFSSYDQANLMRTVQAYNAVIDDIVARHHAILVNLYQQWRNLSQHPEYLSGDGLHPSTLGYSKLAALFYQALQSAQQTQRATAHNPKKP